MLKNVLVNLSVAERRDPACDYAVSVANVFNAHLSGIAFAYDPAVPAIAGGCEVMLPGWIEEERGKAAERAKAAVAKFEAAARRDGLEARRSSTARRRNPTRNRMPTVSKPGDSTNQVSNTAKLPELSVFARAVASMVVRTAARRPTTASSAQPPRPSVVAGQREQAPTTARHDAAKIALATAKNRCARVQLVACPAMIAIESTAGSLPGGE